MYKNYIDYSISSELKLIQSSSRRSALLRVRFSRHGHAANHRKFDAFQRGL